MQNIRLDVHDMKCEGCAGTIREALQDVEGVLGAEVTLEEAEALVQARDDVTADELLAAVDEAGYEASAG